MYVCMYVCMVMYIHMYVYVHIVAIINIQAALSVKDDKIADELIHNILQVNYHGLNARLKKVGSYFPVRTFPMRWMYILTGY